MKALFILSTLTIAGAAVACSPPAQEASPGVGGDVVIGRTGQPYRDEGDMMAKSLAQTERISLAEARRRLVLQHEGGILAEKFRAAYGDKFAGVMFERTPPVHFRFSFVGLDLAKVRDTLPGLGVSADLLPLIRLEAAAETQAQMRATATRMREALEARGIAASVATSIAGSGYKISTREPEKAAEALRLDGIKPGSKVEFEFADPVVITTN